MSDVAIAHRRFAFALRAGGPADVPAVLQEIGAVRAEHEARLRHKALIQE